MSSKLILASISLMAFAMNANAKFEAHEWGTFTSLVGSNGITQDGMTHEDEALPNFVHGFGQVVNTPPSLRAVTPMAMGPRPTQPPPQDPPPDRPCHSKICGDQALFQRNHVTQKMETPVIYFYADHNQHVDVNVKFPEGAVTETFPGPVATSPTMSNKLMLANGNTTFSVNVMAEKTNSSIPAVSSDNIYSHARAVDSNVVVGGNGEVEKFIFYRGLGRFQPLLQIRSAGGDVHFDDSQIGEAPQATFLVHVNSAGEARLMKLPVGFFGRVLLPVKAEVVAQLSDHSSPAQDSIMTGDAAHVAISKELNLAGLNTDEAEAMINTWEHGYLHVPGLRLLYVMPREEVDSVLPLSMTPAPDKLVRVFVGRIEVMTDLQEAQILKDILAQRDAFDVNSLGRFAEPMLRRVQQVYANGDTDAHVMSLFSRLIARSQSGSGASTSL